MNVAPSILSATPNGAVLTAGWIANAVGGRILRGSPSDIIEGVSTDSRTLMEGALFVALRGENFDAHALLPKAALAAGMMLEKRGVQEFGLPQGTSFIIEVDNTGDSLLALGEAYLRKLDPIVIGVTGSAGKTTTKDMIAALAGPQNVAATLGNYNNRIGLPLSILAAPETTKVFVAELGINAPKEMDELARVAKPNVAVLTHVAEAHLEGLHTYQNVLAEKMRIFAHMASLGCTVILPEELDYTAHKELVSQHHVRTFGKTATAAPVGISWDGAAQVGQVRVDAKKYTIRLPLPGQHNLNNLLAALAAVEAVGIEPNLNAIKNLRPSAHRSSLIEINGVRFLDDSYNANPTSMKAALNTAAEIKATGRVHAVLGTMFELGEQSDQFHTETGIFAGEMNLNSLIGFGTAAKLYTDGAQQSDPELATLATSNAEEAAEYLLSNVSPGDLVLVKGSRGAQSEKVIAAFEALHTQEKEV